VSAKILPLPSRGSIYQVGDPVICRRDDRRGFIEQIIPNRVGRPALAAIRVQGGFGLRLLSFVDFRPAPLTARKAARA
jgi:hypothetical protein